MEKKGQVPPSLTGSPGVPNPSAVCPSRALGRMGVGMYMAPPGTGRTLQLEEEQTWVVASVVLRRAVCRQDLWSRASGPQRQPCTRRAPCPGVRGHSPSLREELAELLVKAFQLGARGFAVQAEEEVCTCPRPEAVPSGSGLSQLIGSRCRQIRWG